MCAGAGVAGGGMAEASPGAGAGWPAGGAIAGGAADLGKVMGRVLPAFKGRADGRLVNQIAREELEAG